MLKHSLLLGLFLCGAGNVVSAHQFMQKVLPAGAPGSVRTGPGAQGRDLALFKISFLKSKALELKDVTAKTRTLAAIADKAWAIDEPLARGIFEKALEIISLKTGEEDSELLLYLRQEVITSIAKHDSSWAREAVTVTLKELHLDETSADARLFTLEITLDLLAQAPASNAAAEFVNRSLQQGTSPIFFVSFLQQLRKANKEAADNLFLEFLGRLTLHPEVTVTDFSHLGTYLFTSPFISGDNTGTSIFEVPFIEGFSIIDITSDKPDSSPLLIRAYLEATIKLLNRFVAENTHQPDGYALGYIVLPKARKYAPDLVAPLGSVMAALSTGLSSSFTSERIQAKFTPRNLTTEDELHEIEKIPDPARRNAKYLHLAYEAWHKQDFNQAQLFSDRITDEGIKAELEILIDFGAGCVKLKPGEFLISAESQAAHLPQGLERSVLWLGIAQVAAGEKNAQRVTEAITQALKSVNNAPVANRPLLILLAAGLLADFDKVAAQGYFSASIKAFNNLAESKEKTPVSWRRVLSIGPLVRDFPLDFSKLDFGFERAWQRALPSDWNEGVQYAGQLKNERLRGRAYVVLASNLVAEYVKSSEADVTVLLSEYGIRKSATKTVLPVYPKDALKKGYKGVAVAEVHFDKKGKLTQAKCLESPAPDIAKAVLEAVNQWEFIPVVATETGEAVNVQGKLTFYFVIDKNGKGQVQNPKQFQ